MISVVVPTFNEEKNIEKCLRALNNQTIPREEIEIIVVDGDSKDRTLEIAEMYADKIILQKSEGVGGARNDGFNVATGDIVATTDADCEPYPEWLEVIQQNFNDEGVIAVTGILDPYDWNNMNTVEVYVYKALFWTSNVLLSIFKFFGTAHLCGANSAFDKKVFFEIGGYLPLAYADDTELFKRIKKKGKVVLDRDMKIQYSVRRIEKMGLLNYIALLFKMEWNVSFMNRKPMKGGYARQIYD
ncbi:MAG: glycosyltransferase [Candidatus Bathyarchaeota archaeon]|nr:glycosyltransferase [Candidatus Bathyarchaeota archaeon]